MESHRNPRRLLLGGMVSRPLEPTIGIIAGSSFANTELRLLLADAVKEHYFANPRVRLNIFIDDIAMDATPASKFDTAEVLVKAGQDLSFSSQEWFGLKFAVNKLAVLCNSLGTANLV